MDAVENPRAGHMVCRRRAAVGLAQFLAIARSGVCHAAASAQLRANAAAVGCPPLAVACSHLRVARRRELSVGGAAADAF